MEEVYLLWFLSLSMLICSFLSGLVPLAFRLSDNKSRLLALLGSGILVGTALSIIIPEGIDSLYGRETQIIPVKQPQIPVHNNILNKQAEKQHHGSKEMLETTTSTTTITTTPIPDISHEQIPTDRTKQDMTWLVGMSLIVGFVLMLLIEQFSIYQSGNAGHHHHHHHHHHHQQQQHSPDIVHTNHIQTEYTLACQDDDTDIGLEEDEKAIVDETTSETKPIKISMRANTETSINSSSNTPATIVSSNPNRYYDHSRHLVGHKPKAARVTPTLGLVIHAAADGIALGAAATTSHRDVEMIIFLAIMLHKAPAAFSLVVLLLHNGLRAATIRRHLLAFSLSAPIAAIFTYYGLSQSGKEALRRNNATGIAMLFSAGTFLFVATVHVLPELISNKLLTPREMFFLLGGAFLPLLLTQMI